MARPGGMVTGLTILSKELSQKRLELFREAVPSLTCVAVLLNPNFPAALAVEPQDVVLGQAESADRCLRLQATVWAMPVVAMQPVRQLGGALIGMQIGAGHMPIRVARFAGTAPLFHSSWAYKLWFGRA